MSKKFSIIYPTKVNWSNPFKTHPLYFTLVTLLLAAGVIALLTAGRDAVFLTLNQKHTKAADTFFFFYTHLGDGVFAFIIMLLAYFLFKNKPLAYSLLGSYLLSSLLAQIVKRAINAYRPAFYFARDKYNFFVDGVELAYQNSFPSGHSTTAFAMVTTIILMSSSKKYQLPLFLLAALVGYSRIYLIHHFPADVLFGIFLGTICSYVVNAFVSSGFKIIKL